MPVHYHFNPRTHTGCDSFLNSSSSLSKKISIHAPTRGATQPLSQYLLTAAISIHAPTRGATVTVMSSLLITRNFNPRTHTGCDMHVTKVKEIQRVISIHAPTRGATVKKLNLHSDIRISIHAPTRGATSGLQHFSMVLRDISIHAPTRGATSCD